MATGSRWFPSQCGPMREGGEAMHSFTPRGVCSRHIAFELDGDAPKENDDILFDIRGAAGTSEPVDVTFSMMQFK